MVPYVGSTLANIRRYNGMHDWDIITRSEVVFLKPCKILAVRARLRMAFYISEMYACNYVKLYFMTPAPTANAGFRGGRLNI